MAVFATGGNIGFALGPLIANGAITPLGLDGGLVLAIPGVVIASILLRERGYLSHIRRTRGRDHGDTTESRDRVGAFRLLLGVIAMRSVAYYGLFTFIPLWEVSNGHSKSYGNTLLALELLAGVAGTLIAGPLADRHGRKVVLISSLLLAPGLVLLYVLVGGIPGAIAVCTAGAVIVSTFGVTIVMSQEYLPSRIATASGMSVGMATGLGGVAAVALGAVADAIDLRTALILTAIGPALGAAASVALPGDRLARPVEPARLAD
jgi:FSR family fosmidomycin resistance protein-like MFS transporter